MDHESHRHDAHEPPQTPETPDAHADHPEHGHGSSSHAGHEMHAGHGSRPEAAGSPTRTGGHAEHEGPQHEAMDVAVHGRDVDRAAHPAAHGTQEAGHGAHISHLGHEQMFRDRFWVCLVLSIPVLLYSQGLQQLLGFTMPVFPGSEWIPLILSLVIFAYGGIPFLQMATVELRNRQPGMMMLISLAITTALVYSVLARFLPGAMDFFWELVTLIDVMLLGHWIEMRSVRQASGALDELARLMPDTAERLRPDGTPESVPAGDLRSGDLVLVRPGASIPADGEVESGESDVSEAMITGESRPVKKAPGAKVIGGTLNGDGSLRVRVTATGEQTALAGIMRLVREAQQSKSRTQVLADRAAGWLFYIALAVAAVTAVAWVLAEGFSVMVLERVVTVLVIACPHALGLAVPLVVAITTALGARNGILVRDRLALEAARETNVVIFDKTGTLTQAELGVVGVATAPGWDEERALALAAAVEGDSEHPLARAVRMAGESRRLQLPAVSEFEALKGRGIRAQVDGRSVHVGGPRLLEMLALTPPEDLQRFSREAGAAGRTVVYVVQDQAVVAALAVADVIRPESRRAVERLHEMGIEVAMLTGDSEDVARAVAQELGIDRYFAQVLPEHKDQKVAELQRQGKRVMMVGDGVNDAPALTRADIGIAIGSGTDVAVESAGIILVQSDPLDVVNVIELSRASYRKMIQNLIWATGYNVVALPLAAGVLAWAGILLSPAVGALFMSLSTVIVALNAQLLRGLRLTA